MKRHLLTVVFFIGVLFLYGADSADASSLLVSEGQYSYGGYGRSNFTNMTSALDAATGNNVSVVSDFGNLSAMLSYDAIWLDARDFNATLSAIEVNNIATFIATGRKAVLVGENDAWDGWNNQLMSIVGGDYNSYFSGYTNSITSHELTNGVNTVYLPAGGIVVSGGMALFDQNFATLWNDNVLTVLDLNVHTDTYWGYSENAQFAMNVADWIADSNNDNPEVPEPTTMFLLGSVALGMFGMKFKIKK